MQWKTLGNVSLLITDDDEFNRQLLLTLLSKIPTLHCFEAGNGVEALEILENNDIDMILLDIHMPKMDGHETLKRIKENERYRNLSITIITTDEVEKKIFYKLGADDFISKPFDLKKLETRVYTQIEKKKAQASLPPQKSSASKKNPPTEKEILSNEEKIEKSQKEIFFMMAKMLYLKENSFCQNDRIAKLAKAFAYVVGYNKNIRENLYYATFISSIGESMILSNHKDIIESKKAMITGYKLLNSAIDNDFILMAKRVMIQQKEHYDGTGYPQQSKEKEIHLVAYMVSIINSFDKQLISNEENQKEEIKKFFLSNSSTIFHPKLVTIFIKNIDYFMELREKIIENNKN